MARMLRLNPGMNDMIIRRTVDQVGNLRLLRVSREPRSQMLWAVVIGPPHIPMQTIIYLGHVQDDARACYSTQVRVGEHP